MPGSAAARDCRAGSVNVQAETVAAWLVAEGIPIVTRLAAAQELSPGEGPGGPAAFPGIPAG